MAQAARVRPAHGLAGVAQPPASYFGAGFFFVGATCFMIGAWMGAPNVLRFVG